MQCHSSLMQTLRFQIKLVRIKKLIERSLKSKIYIYTSLVELVSEPELNRADYVPKPYSTVHVLYHTNVKVWSSRVWYAYVRIRSSTERVRFEIGTFRRQVRWKRCIIKDNSFCKIFSFSFRSSLLFCFQFSV